ncbi:hypothetical protein K435DRAFT_802325 [Dendrothele bispora CBS 962.96]|uniref:Uncharacterized protein n=1 Tax=Dendrothele bispora (strain CBS 962.96) TaxID=1314807 RepID=A0A4V4HE71_DENBC|nr:hypothetical protein K435DRAFT_802325 [Dendrothele bispora CBS 962.96]
MTKKCQSVEIYFCPLLNSIVESLVVSSPSSSSSLSPSESFSSRSSSHLTGKVKPKYTSDLPLHLIPTRLIQAHQHAIAKFQQTQREIKLEAREIQREKWRRVGDAGEGWEEVVGALGLVSNGRNGNNGYGFGKRMMARIMGAKSKKVLLLPPGPDMTDDLRARLGEVEEKLARLLSRMESSFQAESESQPEMPESDLEADGSARDRRSRGEGEKIERLGQKITDSRLEKVFLEKWLWAIEEGEKRRAERKLLGMRLKRMITRLDVSTGFGRGLWTR